MATQTISNAGPRIKTKLPGPKAQAVLQGDAKYVSPSYTRSYPLVAKRGRGVIVEDVDGMNSWISPLESPWFPPDTATPKWWRQSRSRLPN